MALAGVDCDGNETSITECPSNNGRIGTCTDITTNVVLACANSVGGELLTTHGTVADAVAALQRSRPLPLH